MRKILSVLMLAILLFVVSGCEKEEVKRTYMADGTYMVWELGSTTSNLLNPDGTNYVNPADGKAVKASTPVLSTLKVTIANDKVVKYEIDELQSKPYVAVKRGTTDPNVDENGYVKAVTWKWNDMTKRELEYGYGMETNAAFGEWYIQVLNLENYWLAKGEPVDDEVAKTSVTITYANYTQMAKKALQNAKDGVVGAITDREHYTYDVTFVTAKVNKEGKISDVNLDAHLFGTARENTYTVGNTDYLKFDWNPKAKYESYGAMSNDKKWQDQIDVLEDFVNENGWDGSIMSGNGTDPYKGLNKVKGLNAETNKYEIEVVMASVTIQTYREVLVLNMLREFFPTGWAK